MSSRPLSLICAEEEVGQWVHETISVLSKKVEGKLLTIVGYPFDEGDCMFEGGMYLSVFNCFGSVKERSVDMLEEQLREERDPDLEVEAYM